MDPSIVVALIITVPGTVAAVGSLYHARRAEGQAREANLAVNHKAPDEDSISRQVSDIHASMGEVKADMADVKGDMRSVKAEVRDLRSRVN